MTIEEIAEALANPPTQEQRLAWQAADALLDRASRKSNPEAERGLEVLKSLTRKLGSCIVLTHEHRVK